MSVQAGQTRLMRDGTRVYVMKVGPERRGSAGHYVVELLIEDGPQRGATIERSYGTVDGYMRADLPKPHSRHRNHGHQKA